MPKPQVNPLVISRIMDKTPIKMMTRKILIVEDEPSIADNISLALKREGMNCHTCHLGREAVEFLQQEEVDLITLDIGLPDMMGTEVCREVRRISKVPIIFLSARDDEIDKVLGLELGADDYIVKPFSPRELVARINAIFRRVDDVAPSDSVGAAHQLLLIDNEKKQALLHGHDLQLTPHELGILQILAAHPGRVCSRDYLLGAVWKDELDVNDRVVDTHVKSIRAKVVELESAGKLDGKNTIIKTHRGFGYSLVKELVH